MILLNRHLEALYANLYVLMLDISLKKVDNYLRVRYIIRML